MKKILLILFVFLSIALYPVFIYNTYPPQSRYDCGTTNRYHIVTTISSVQSGNWSDPATWGGIVPSATDAPLIAAGTTVTADISITVGGMQINGILKLDSTRTITLIATKNILNNGLLQAKPVAPGLVHTIRFTGINEKNYIGGGESPMDSDVGLWVMGSGQLDLQGTSKTGWIQAAGDLTKGGTSITLRGPPSNWAAGDELAIAPTAPTATDFDQVTINNLTGQFVFATTPLKFAHPRIVSPMTGASYTAEVMNLTRNVRIEGTASGKAHVFIRSNKAQIIRFVQFRYLGPRKDINKDGRTEVVLGRYGIHFHHCGDSSNRSLVENCVMRDVDNHGYVTHGSNGITVKGCVAFNVTETPYWWDEGAANASHSITWDGNIAALVKYVPGSLKTEVADKPTNNSSVGYLMGYGDDNVAVNNVAVGTTGDGHTGGGYNWEAIDEDHLEGIWDFENNLSHNCTSGLRNWQNTVNPHVIRNFVAYNCGESIFNGAYSNSFRYIGGEAFGGPVEARACSAEGVKSRSRFENMNIQNFVMLESAIGGQVPMLVRGNNIGTFTDQVGGLVHSADLVGNNISGKMSFNGATTKEVLRVQPPDGSNTLKMTRSGNTIIAPFAPVLWGDGTGLTGTYFQNPNFTDTALVRVDAYIGWSEWNNGVHHRMKSKQFSVRWTGFVLPQFTEKYTFRMGVAGDFKLWVNDQLIISDGSTSGTVNLIAGNKVSIRVDFSNTETSLSGGINLYWTSASLEKFSPGGEYVPQSQLYPK